VRNTQRLTAGSLLVLDVGAEFAHYAADITRTISIGEPSERQKAVLIAVTRVHDAAIALCQPGKSIKEYDAEVEAILYEELVHLGLLTRKSRRRDVYNWMPHAIGHSLGIEVHDTPLHSETLQAGMLLTVEPGIYIPQEGLGVRIEDDILIDVSGPQILSGHLPVNPTPQS
jgi:Xaa-Pro aminopeptidase